MIRAKALKKFYPGCRAVDDISFEIDEGEIIGFLGLNGAGKSTTLKLLSTLILPSSGKVTIAGLDLVNDADAIRHIVGFLPETPPIYPEMTTEDYLLFTAKLRGLDHRVANKHLDEVLELTNLKDVRHQVTETLSHGYRQRVGIAQAIIHRPKIVILDEPIKGLDPLQIIDIRNLIRNLKEKHTVILSSHILHEISQTCDRLLVIKEGKIVASGREEELTARFAHHTKMIALIRGEFDQAQKALETLDTILSVEKIRTEDRLNQDGTFQDAFWIEIQSDQDIRGEIARVLVEANQKLLQLQPAEQELEQAFIALSQRTSEQITSGQPL